MKKQSQYLSPSPHQKLSRRTEMKALRYVILFLLINIPVYAISSPILPENVNFSFEGIFWVETGNSSYGTYNPENLVYITPISGQIEFNLIQQDPLPGYDHLDYVTWEFSGTTSDNSISFNGHVTSDWITKNPSDISSLDWIAYNWDYNLDPIEEFYTDILWGNGFSAGPWPTTLENPPWNLLTNENFLPQQMQMSFPGYDLSISNSVSVVGCLNFELTPAAPVPEPSTMLLLSAGIVGLTFYSRKKNARSK